jgi:hypothetical protein
MEAALVLNFCRIEQGYELPWAGTIKGSCTAVDDGRRFFPRPAAAIAD